MRQKLKPYVPSFLWTSLRRCVTYGRRLQTWRAVTRQIAGISDADKAYLREASRSGWRTAFQALDEWQDPVLLNDARVVVHSVGEFALRAYSDDLYHVLPAREGAVLAQIRQCLKPGDTFVDAGANIGFYTVVAAKLVGPTGKVLAIEMMPDTAARLRKHIRMNDLANVEVIEFALSDRSGETITATVPEGKFGQASIMAEGDTLKARRVGVQTCTLDDILGSINERIALMKMDLEGAETVALKGARNTVDRIDAIILEQLDDDPSCMKLLQSHGFDLLQIDAHNILASRISKLAR